MSSRRDVLQSFVAGAVAVPAAALAKGTPRAPEEIPTGTAPWALLAPLQLGSELPLGWRIESLSAVERGAAILTLHHESGGHANIHLCKNGGQPLGIAYSEHVDLVLMNGGTGERPTEESIGRVLLALAEHMKKNGVALQGALTHAERVSRYGRDSLR